MITPIRMRSLGGKTMALPLLFLGLSACAGSPYDVDARQCSPSQHQVLVGRNVGEILLPPTLRKREVWSGVMTNDFNPARLTMYVDAKGFVTRVACG
nr:I78 family peptidase inhibitor [Paracoccus saliphilus]